MVDDQPATAAGRTLSPADLFPPPGHRYFTDERIEAVRQFALAQSRCSIDSRTVLELVCDWRNMTAEVDRLRRVERHAREVMDALQEHGEGIVGHLLDDDDNSGEFLRRALNDEAER